MTASIVLRDYRVLDEQTQQDLNTIAEAVNSIKSEYVNFFSRPEKDYKDEYRKILVQTTMCLKKCVNATYKVQNEIEIQEIEQIKNSLSNFAQDDAKVKAFKKEMIGDLTEFQKTVENKYQSRITEMRKQHSFCVRKILVLEAEKNKLIMDRLSKILWPYDEKTKAYDMQIEKFKLQARTFTMKIQEANITRPKANEKDLLIYQMKIKEKYADLY